MSLQKISITLQKDCEPQSVFSKLEFFGLQNAILQDFTIIGEVPIGSEFRWAIFFEKIPGVDRVSPIIEGFRRFQ